MRRATDTTLENHLNRIISIHALHEESDPLYGANALLPAISIHALHEENDGDAVEDRADLRISIHALHEESDLSCLHLHGRGLIPIHALHEESDMLRESEAYGPSSFQSTLSMRRATRAAAMGRGQAHFNPRSP